MLPQVPIGFILYQMLVPALGASHAVTGAIEVVQHLSCSLTRQPVHILRYIATKYIER